jgi:hypothetical protein
MRFILVCIGVVFLASCKKKDDSNPTPNNLENRIPGKWKVVQGPFKEIEFMRGRLALARIDTGPMPIRIWKTLESNGIAVKNLGQFRNVQITSDTVFSGEFLPEGESSWKTISMLKIPSKVIPTVSSSTDFYQSWILRHIIIEGDSISMDTVGQLTMSFASSGTHFITGAYNFDPFEGLVFDPTSTEEKTWNWQSHEARAYCEFESNAQAICDSSNTRFVEEVSPTRLIIEERSFVTSRFVLTPFVFTY